MHHIIFFHALAFVLGIHQVFTASSPTEIPGKGDASSPKQASSPKHEGHFVPPVLTSARRTKSGNIPYSEWDERTKAEFDDHSRKAMIHERIEYHMKKSDLKDQRERYATKKVRQELRAQKERHKRYIRTTNVVKKANDDDKNPTQ